MSIQITCLLDSLSTDLSNLSESATDQLTLAIKEGDLSLITTALYNLTALLISSKGLAV